MPDNTALQVSALTRTLQVSALTRTYRLLLREEDITRSQLKAKLIVAQAVMEDGSEINAVGFEGGSTAAVVLYPKEVVITALLDVLEESDPAGSLPGFLGDSSVVHADLSASRIES